MSAVEKRNEGWRRWRGRVIAAAVVGAITWLWLFFGGGHPPDLHRAAEMGNAFGPIATFATAAALFVGFDSLRLQREALSGQQEEITQTLRELARTADAQEKLAKAQRDSTVAQASANKIASEALEAQRELAKVQTEANHRTLALEHSQRIATIAALEAARVQAQIDLQDTARHGPREVERARTSIVQLDGVLASRIAIEETTEAAVRKKLVEHDDAYIQRSWIHERISEEGGD